MWEDATPKPVPDAGDAAETGRPAGGSPAREKAGENYVLWARIILVALALAGVFAARQLGLPAYTALRTAFRQAMQEQGVDAFGDERELVRFIQTGLADLEQAAAQAAVRLADGAATAESARAAHGQPARAAPAGASTESYQPAFALALPLPAGFAPTSGYGWRDDPLTADGSEDFHLGADLAAAEGTPVYAAADGVVRWSGLGQSYGNYLRILHADGDETLYAHMQYLFVHPGQQVRQGQVIGTVGQTGDVTGPHLHFELLHEGIRYDPAAALGLG